MTNIETLRAELERAEQEEAEELQRQRIAKLAEARAELRRARARYQELNVSIKADRAARAEVQGRTNHVAVRLNEHLRQRPAVADYLPEDPEVVAWRKERTELQQERERLIAERDALPDPEASEYFKEACSYEGPFGIIATLEFTVQNLLHQLEGRSGIIRIEGGISGVS